jgi:DUF971 family protein
MSDGDEHDLDATEPTGIIVQNSRRLVEITWADGHRSSYPFALLRWACPCAHCRGEMGRPGVLASTVALTPAQQALVDLQLVGRYAVQPRWADGHETGLYAFEDLRAICPCAQCARSRQSG